MRKLHSMASARKSLKSGLQRPATSTIVTRITTRTGVCLPTLGFRVMRSRCAIESDSIVDRKCSRRCGSVSTLPLGSAVRTGSGRVSAFFRRSIRGKRKRRGCADFLHPLCAQVGDAPSQSRLGHGNSVVQIDSATALHSVIDIQNHFGRCTPPGVVEVMGATVTRSPDALSRRRASDYTEPAAVSGREAGKTDPSPLLRVPATPRHPPRCGTLPRAAGGPNTRAGPALPIPVHASA